MGKDLKGRELGIGICQQSNFTKMAKEGYRNSTIYQTRIALYNMLEFAKENEVIRSNPCKRSVKSDIGKETEKKEALTIEKKTLKSVPKQCKLVYLKVPYENWYTNWYTYKNPSAEKGLK